MKASVISKSKSALGIGMCLGLSMLLATSDANAHRVLFVPEAVCSTIVTNMPLPTYVCCELLDEDGHHVFRDKWVSGSCKNASPYAHYDMGCKPDSLVYGTNEPIPPIAGFCQFSYSTGKYI